MNSSGDMTNCVVPLRQGGREVKHHSARSFGLGTLVGQRGRTI